MDHFIRELGQKRCQYLILKYRTRGHIFRELKQQRATFQTGRLGWMKYEMRYCLWLASCAVHDSYMLNEPERSSETTLQIQPSQRWTQCIHVLTRSSYDHIS